MVDRFGQTNCEALVKYEAPKIPVAEGVKEAYTMYRYFNKKHQDFGIMYGAGIKRIMLRNLNENGKPEFNKRLPNNDATHGIINFNEWFNTVGSSNTEKQDDVAIYDQEGFEIVYAWYGVEDSGVDCTE